MTRLARGAKCGSPGSPVPARRSEESREARAAAPSPVLVRPKKCRRVSRFFRSSIGSMVLFLRNRLVQIQNHTGHRCVGGQLGPVQSRISRRIALIQELPGLLCVGRKIIPMEVEIVAQDLLVRRWWPAAGTQPEPKTQSRTRI